MPTALKPKKPAPSTPARVKARRSAPAVTEGKTRAARRREHSREEILDATRDLILQHGIRGLTLEAVAEAVGLTKAAIYYYYPSKDALLEALSLRTLRAQAQRLHDAVEATATGPQALRSLISETIRMNAQQMDDFRLSHLHLQLAPDDLQVGPEQLAQVRPLNDLSYAGAASRLAAGPRGRADVEPRMMAFLATQAALGVVMMKGLVEAFNDPLRYTDEELIEALARIFEAAARP